MNFLSLLSSRSLKLIIGLFFFLNVSMLYSQEPKKAYNLGVLNEFVNSHVESSSSKSYLNEKFNLKVSPQKTVAINIAENTCKNDEYYLFGRVDGFDNATFYIKGNNDGIKGKLLFYDEEIAYSIFTNEQKEVIIEQVDIHSQVCLIKDKMPTSNIVKKATSNIVKEPNLNSSKNMQIPQLESFPGAPGVLYLDFDGEVVSGGGWGYINASSSGLSDSQIEEIFYIISEDYAPFNINVTTKRQIYDNANNYSRQMVIFNTTFPDNPGVATFNSFNNGSGEPCWVKVGGVVQLAVKAANVGSHEAGHTFGLYHDGTSSVEYYPGHSFYRVIMGTVTNGYSQFCKGEYSGANNYQDDFQIISGNTNNVGFRSDDHGDGMNSSSNLIINDAGEILENENYGLIEKQSDLDYFKLDVDAADISIQVRPADQYSYSQNLDLKIRLLNASGNEIASADGSGFNPSSITETVAGGVYYLEIDGVGMGNASSNGYSDYGSVGQYFISGQITSTSLNVVDFNENETDFKIFPNPSSKIINIQHEFEKANYQIITLHGAIVSKGILENKLDNFDVSLFAKGIYFLKIKSGNDIYTSKIIIK